MCSVSASMATRAFNSFRLARHGFIKEFKWAEFDSRVFQIAQRTEVENYFIWRQKDTMRNSVSSVSQSMFSTKELHGKDTDKQKEMILSKGMDWEDFKPEYKYGRIITKENYEIEGGAMRTRWVSNPPPIFTQSRIFLDRLIPTNL